MISLISDMETTLSTFFLMRQLSLPVNPGYMIQEAIVIHGVTSPPFLLRMEIILSGLVERFPKSILARSQVDTLVRSEFLRRVVDMHSSSFSL